MTEQATVSRRHRARPRGAEAQQTLVKAYRDVFLPGGTADEQQKQIVLSDLANTSGFYRVGEPPMTADDRAFADGKRAVFNRVLAMVRMPPELIVSLETAAKLEEAVDSAMEE